MLSVRILRLVSLCACLRACCVITFCLMLQGQSYAHTPPILGEKQEPALQYHRDMLMIIALGRIYVRFLHRAEAPCDPHNKSSAFATSIKKRNRESTAQHKTLLKPKEKTFAINCQTGVSVSLRESVVRTWKTLLYVNFEKEAKEKGI